MSKPEPTTHKIECDYCGDAYLNHKASYIESLIAVTIDKHTTKLVSRVPKFVKRFVDYIPKALFTLLTFFRIAKYSDDIEKTASFRSRIIWEEANRRGIKMEQILIFGKASDHYRARFPDGRVIYFESIPILPEFLDMKNNWDDKLILKQEFSKVGVPVPAYFRLPFYNLQSLENIFKKFKTPVIVKPQVGSRARHTTTNISTLPHFKEAVRIASQISPYLVVEEYLLGDVCRATLVNGKLAGFYRGTAPHIVGDGVKTIRELIDDKDNSRHERIQKVNRSQELHDHIGRFGFVIDDVLPKDLKISLSHRVGRLFGGSTREMVDELHPSFIPHLEKAANTVGLAVAGFDCIVPEPTKDASEQRWGIIECNTLPFIDLHYYALEGKPRNIAGMIWDMWD